MRSVIDIKDLSTTELNELVAVAEDIIENPDKYAHKCDRKKLATLFFEPSTRTRLSFEAAMYELGGHVLSMSAAGSSSAAKGESVADTAKTVSCYADIIAMRHPKEGAPLVAAMNASIPVINNITSTPLEELEDYSVTVYVVKAGDTLWKIAKRFGSTVDDIVRVNGIERPDKLNVAEKIYIPRYVLKRAKEPIILSANV